jgi:hypothetical protein
MPPRASRRLCCAIFAEYVIGLKDYAALVKPKTPSCWPGCPRHPRQALPGLPPLAAGRRHGARQVHLLRIRLKGKYPQWSYWMAMPFTAPIPWEADAFYAQPGMSENGLSLNQWPVGTGRT